MSLRSAGEHQVRRRSRDEEEREMPPAPHRVTPADHFGNCRGEYEYPAVARLAQQMQTRVAPQIRAFLRDVPLRFEARGFPLLEVDFAVAVRVEPLHEVFHVFL